MELIYDLVVNLSALDATETDGLEDMVEDLSIYETEESPY